MSAQYQPTRESPEDLTGSVERVTFHSEESGFCVLRVKVRGHRELVTIAGTLPEIRPGEWLEAHGRWVVDPKHGQQFKAETLQTTQPDTTEGIERYLGSGLIKGIGPKLANKLVGRFGKQVLDVIDTSSRRLQVVPGIGPKRVTSIAAAWKEQKVVRQIMVFLHSHGVTAGQ